MPAPIPHSRPLASPAVPDGAGRADDDGKDTLLDELSLIELEALRWSVRMSDGLSSESRAEFLAWLGASPEHREVYEDMAGVLDAIDEIPGEGRARLRTTVAIDAASASSAQDLALRASVADETRLQPESAAAAAVTAAAPGGFRLARRKLPSALAAVVALAVLGGGWLRWQSQPVFNQDYASERGRGLDVALPDGSRLLLDTITQADVTLYRDRREVRLPEGQVLFHVQADKARPFDVLAGAARITVVGTKFSVRYTPSMGSQAVQVAVIEGRVRVQGSNAVEITAGQAVTADARGELGAVVDVPVATVATWRSQRLNFDAVPLADVLAEINRYGDVSVRLADADAGRLAVTASVNLHQVDAFVRTLPQVLPVRLVQRGASLEIETVRR